MTCLAATGTTAATARRPAPRPGAEQVTSAAGADEAASKEAIGTAAATAVSRLRAQEQAP